MQLRVLDQMKLKVLYTGSGEMKILLVERLEIQKVIEIDLMSSVLRHTV